MSRLGVNGITGRSPDPSLAEICRHEPHAGIVTLAVRGSRAACWILAGRKPCVHIKQRPRDLTAREASAIWRALEDLNLWPSDS